MAPISYADLLKLAAPETLVVIAALAALGVDLTAMRGVEMSLRRMVVGMIACAGCAAGVAWMLAMPEQGRVMDGVFVVDHLTQLIKVSILALAAFSIVLSVNSSFTQHVGEFTALVLFAAVGMMFLVSSEDLLMIFISLELTSLSLYILTAFNKRDPQSTQAAMKYFLFGGMAAAFTLFGFSLLYGLAGSTNLGRIAAAVQGPRLDPILALAIVMVVVGFGFKVAAAPFHLWAPDAYQGAPAPSAAFIASGSKVASFFVFAKVMMIGLKGVEGSGAWQASHPGWVPVVATVAGLSMILGNLAALVQSSTRRLLAYSAIAHAGYLLLGLLSSGKTGFASLMFYAITYGLTTVGAFCVVMVVQDRTGSDGMKAFAGLSRRAPLVSFCMMIFILSLGGIPPLVGFFGKFYLFSAAAAAGPSALGMLWLVALAIAMSAVSLYYYLQVLKQIYVADPPADAPFASVAPATQVVLALLAAAVVVAGCAPEWLLSRLLAALQGAGF
jgi:NADH-quinone oxidoreductase subunit N